MKQAVVIVNLGTPSAPTTQAVRLFLKEFLSDPRVVEVSRIIWNCILHGIILPFRSPKVAAAYEKIWWENGSPLRVITESQVALLDAKLHDSMGSNAPLVRHAMTYSGPSIAAVVDELLQEGAEHILLLPLYPQYSATTTGSVYDRVTEIVTQSRNIPELQVIKQYFDHPLYIDALAQTVREHWQKDGRPSRLLMSFHGIPQRNCDLGDPYYEQCKTTASLLANQLNLSADEWQLSFQSRLGRAQWLTPYTIDVVESWGKEKLQSMAVICPAFSADCLETLEEINVENRKVFQDNGGGRFSVVTCLNDHAAHIDLMAALVKSYLPGPPEENN